MKQSRFTEGQIIGILKEHETGVSVAELCRKHGVMPLPGKRCMQRREGMRRLKMECQIWRHGRQRGQTA